MSAAVAAVRALLVANASLTATVPATRIMAGVLPQGTTVPAIGLTLISRTTARDPVAGNAANLYTSRVQVTVLAGTYAALRAAVTLVLAALPRSRGTYGGAKVDALMFDAEGPEFMTDEGIHQTSVDVMVKTIE